MMSVLLVKFHKIEMYIIDYNDDYSTLEDIISDMELATNSIINCFDTKEVNIEWHDDIGF